MCVLTDKGNGVIFNKKIKTKAFYKQLVGHLHTLPVLSKPLRSSQVILSDSNLLNQKFA